MKIVMPILRFKPSVGGGEEHAYQLGKALVTMGHEVTVYTSDLRTHYPRLTYLENSRPVEDYDGIRVRRFHAIPRPKEYPVLTGYFRSLMRETCDIIHAHGYGYSTSDAAALVSLLRGKALVLTTHGFFPATTQTNPLLKSAYVEFSKKSLLRIAKTVITVSSADADHYRRLGDSRKIVIIPNGIDLEYWSKPAKPVDSKNDWKIHKPLIASAGRITFGKGFQYLIRAAPLILRKFPEAKIAIAGEDFGYMSELRELSRKVGVGENVLFLGLLSQDQIKRLYLDSDIVVVPSVYEPFGLVALEAMACGKPVVASCAGGLMETVLSGTNGLLFPPGNHEALASCVVSLLEDSELAENMARSNREEVKRYSWHNLAKRVESEYWSLGRGQDGNPRMPPGPARFRSLLPG